MSTSVSENDSPSFAYGGDGMACFDGHSWRSIAASVTGSSHIAKGKGCDDAASAREFGPWLLAVVSDGAGSASHGGDGASLVVKTVIDELIDILSLDDPLRLSDVIHLALSHTRLRLSNEATERKLEIRSFAATVVGAVLRGSHGVFFHLGDGSAVAFDSSDEIVAHSLGTPKEYANETHFLSDEHWSLSLQITPLWKVDSLMLMSDGVSPFAIDGRTAKATFYKPLFGHLKSHISEAGVKALKRLFENPEASRQVADDKTLLWATMNLGSKDAVE
jgi:hypothetical protein